MSGILNKKELKKINKQKLTAVFILSKGIFCLILKQVFFYLWWGFSKFVCVFY